LRRRDAIWFATVLGDVPRSSAISAFDLPIATLRRTASSAPLSENALDFGVVLGFGDQQAGDQGADDGG